MFYKNEIDTTKEKNDDKNTFSYRLPRLLGRKYLFTRTGYKYLDIGINVSASSQVEIGPGDSHSKEVVLTFDIRKGLLHQRDIILQFFNTDRSDEHVTPRPIYIEYLTLRFGKINNLKILRLETPTMCLAMSKSTVCNMFALDLCINRLFLILNSVTEKVDDKFLRFLEIANNAKNRTVEIRNSV